MSAGTGSGRETVRISLGPSANAVSAHLSNLEGMACTSDDPGESPPLCDPHVTHRLRGGYLVPRCVFVDSRDGFGGGDFGGGGGQDDSSLVTPTMMDGAFYGGVNGMMGSGSVVTTAPAAWGGQVERLHRRHLDRDSSPSNGNDDRRGAEAEGADPFAAYRAASARAAASRFDRRSDRGSHGDHSTRHRYPTSSYSSNDGGRHVDWDDDDDDEEEEEEGGYSDEEGMARARDRRRRDALNRRTALEVDATAAWEGCVSVAAASSRVDATPTPGSDGGGAVVRDAESRPRADGGNPEVVIPWRDYLAVPPNSMPPSSMLALPFHSPSPSPSNGDAWAGGSFVSGHSGITREWREDELSESIRCILEECDTVQGFQILSDDGGTYAGLASTVLEELADECRSAARLSVLVSSSGVGGGRGGGTGADAASSSASSSSWGMRQSFRRTLNDGLSLHGVASRSDAALPLDLSLCRSALDDGTMTPGGAAEAATAAAAAVFRGGAAAALAMEASTLPYRLLGSSPKDGRVAMAGLGAVGDWGGGGGGGFYPTAARVGYRGFVSDLLGGPSGRHNLLAMDARVRPLPGANSPTMATATAAGGGASLPPTAAMLMMSLGRGPGGAVAGGGGAGGGELYRLLASGTSIERTGRDDPRLRSRRTADAAPSAEPGAWMADDGRGVLSPLSLPRARPGDPGQHEHTNYALHASLRPSDGDLLAATDPVGKYTPPLMEGLAARRPTDGFSSCVVRQSVDGLTSGGYGYWRSSVFPPPRRFAPPSPGGGGGGGEGGDHSPSPSPAPPTTTAGSGPGSASTISSSPVLALLSNSTRIHPYLHRRAVNLKRALSRPHGGYYNAESAAGLAPEREDCDEAAEYLRDLEGSYDSGMDLVDLDGAYFDSNED